jgi:hypothetical protein
MPKVVGQRSHKEIIQARKKEVITFHFHNFHNVAKKIKSGTGTVTMLCLCHEESCMILTRFVIDPFDPRTKMWRLIVPSTPTFPVATARAVEVTRSNREVLLFYCLLHRYIPSRKSGFCLFFLSVIPFCWKALLNDVRAFPTLNKLGNVGRKQGEDNETSPFRFDSDQRFLAAKSTRRLRSMICYRHRTKTKNRFD